MLSESIQRLWAGDTCPKTREQEQGEHSVLLYRYTEVVRYRKPPDYAFKVRVCNTEQGTLSLEVE